MELLFWFILGIVVGVNIIFFLGLLSFFWGVFGGAPFVPTDKKTMDTMFDLAGNLVGKKIYDLGCGDGRFVFAAAEKGANAMGIDIAWWLVIWANGIKKIFKKKGSIVHASLWDFDFSDADIIFLYLLPPMMKRFEEEKFSTLKKGAKIISHGFSFPTLVPCLIQPREGMRKGKILVYEKS